ncbi:MAG TPA: hypothetical protein VF069_23990 [Streptosporangiaceae bacterium]
MDAEKPFDALETYLCDEAEASMAKRRTASLVTGVRVLLERGEDLRNSTVDARYAKFRAIADELTRRGIDATSLVRYGMWRQVSAPLIGGLLADRMIPGVTAFQIGEFDHKAWSNALGVPTTYKVPLDSPLPDIVSSVSEIVIPLVRSTLSWISTATLDQMVRLDPPARVATTDSNTPPLDANLCIQYRWIVDHFSYTFYREWDTPSLHCAYRWLNGREIPPCSPELMSDRKVDRNQLNEEIARRSVPPDSTSRFKGNGVAAAVVSGAMSFTSSSEMVGVWMRPLMSDMMQYAKRLLQEGRYREAAAVFEFGAQGLPHDAELRNNVGFCLIPENAQDALQHLERAADMNYPHKGVNIYNQMCCYAALARPRAALNLAESFWTQIGKSTSADAAASSGATIWRLQGDDSWELSSTEDTRQSIASFAAAIAVREGWHEYEQLWRGRERDFERPQT